MKTAAPRMTLALAGITAISFAVATAVGHGEQFAYIGGFVPARLTGLHLLHAMPVALTPLTATLIHAGILHLGFNLLMLGFCGREDEVALGPAGVVLLYGVGAYVAAAGQFIVGPRSIVPMIGASGAISALVGAYAILYGQRRPSRLPPELARWLHVLWLAAAWIGLQLLLGYASAIDGLVISIAAHIGGFLAGLVLARPLLRWRYRSA